MSKIIGIDLRYNKQLRSSYGRRQSPLLSQIQKDRRTTPSVVAFTKTGETSGRRAGKASGSYQRRHVRSLPSRDIWAVITE